MSTTRKLYSRKGTLLGLLTFPGRGEYLARDGAERFPVYRPLLFHRGPTVPDVETSTITLVESPHDPVGEGVELIGGPSLLDIETMPGWSFSPSLAYIKSQLE